jgi:hypothetical protein
MIFEAISLEITSNIKDIEKPSRSRDKGLGRQGEFRWPPFLFGFYGN